MIVKEGFMLREVAGSYVVVAVGKASTSFKGYIALNATGAFLWKCLEKGATEEQLVKKLLDEYEISEEIAKHDVTMFVERIKENNLVEE